MLSEWSDTPGMKDSSAAAELFSELNRLTERLAELETEIKTMTGNAPAERVAPLTESAQLMIKFRKDRDKVFSGLFKDSTWDVFLSIAALGPNRPAQISSIGYDAEVPQTSALRHIALLEMAGLVERTPNPHDRRSFLLSLTPLGRERLRGLFEKWPLALALLAPVAMLIVKFYSW